MSSLFVILLPLCYYPRVVFFRSVSCPRLTFRSHLVVSCIPVLELKFDRLDYSRLLWYAGKLHLPTNRWINCELIWQLRDLALVLFAAVRNVQPRSTIRKHRSQTCRGLLYRKLFMRSNFLQTTDFRSSIRHKTSPTLDTDSSTTNSLDKLSSTNAPVIALGHEQRRSYVICLRGVLLVVAAYVKRVKMLWWAASFSLCC